MGLFSDWIEGDYGWTAIFVIIIIFTLITMWFYYTKDKYEPEPINRIIVAYFYGMLSVIPALIISLIAVSLVSVNMLLTAVILAPIIEEFTKGFFVVHLSKHDSFDGPLDGIIYGSMVGAGFATIENILYGFFTSADLSIIEGVEITFYRSFAQIIGHPLYTGIMGAGVGAYKVGLQKNQYSLIWQSIVLHGMWNGAASLVQPVTFFGGLMIVAIISAIRLRNELTYAIDLDRKAFERGYYEQKTRYLKYMKAQHERWYNESLQSPVNNFQNFENNVNSQYSNQLNQTLPSNPEISNENIVSFNSTDINKMKTSSNNEDIDDDDDKDN